MKYRKKPIVVDAEGPLAEPRLVETAHGRVLASVGDYVLTDPATGDTWPIKPDILARTYLPLADADPVPVDVGLLAVLRSSVSAWEFNTSDLTRGRAFADVMDEIDRLAPRLEAMELRLWSKRAWIVIENPDVDDGAQR